MTMHRIMHFTHIRNLAGILRAGCLRADASVDRASALQVEAADLAIKASRKEISVTLAPYGRVADYVPFYFAPRSPMLYKLHKGGVPTYTEGQDPLVHLVSAAETVIHAGMSCLFSDGNCAAYVTQVFDDMSLLDSMIDWEVMDALIWKNTAEDPDRMRRRMAEFLVHDHVPISCLASVVVRTEAAKQRAVDTLGTHRVALPVQTPPGWYF
jgi:ssDNA thymidine ADP-ribosyltransferase, DarT